MKYKYNIGDTVNYDDMEVVYEACGSCGHEGSHTITTNLSGVITHREKIMTLEDEFKSRTKTEILPSGITLRTLFLGKPEKSNWYEINGTHVHEDDIINLTKNGG